MAAGVLDGMRVVEAGAFVAAPLGGMTLAQMGADVIRIDPLGGGLDYRRWPVTDDDTSLFWCGLNQCKRSVALDLSCAEGREIDLHDEVVADAERPGHVSGGVELHAVALAVVEGKGLDLGITVQGPGQAGGGVLAA